jgi:hypothetical protein
MDGRILVMRPISPRGIAALLIFKSMTLLFLQHFTGFQQHDVKLLIVDSMAALMSL